jgi:ABC-type sugar transport system ATPase subunit
MSQSNSPALAEGGRAAGASSLELLSCRRIEKYFGAQRALADVDFDVAAGEIHALVGENGAGKSTLIKIVGGHELQNSGVVYFDGAEQPVHHPWDAQRLGIGIVHQHPEMVGGLSIAENIALGSGLTTRRGGIVSWKREFERSAELLARVGVEQDPRRPASVLSVHERQLVALARALRLGLKLLILDEITAPLTQLEIARLFTLIRRIASEGVGVVYVSHRLSEVFELTQRVTVMRDGRRVATRPTAELDRDELISLMIGREASVLVEPAVSHADLRADPVVEVRGLSGGAARDVSFDVHPGEIVGLAGLSGSGRSSILETLFGLHGKGEHTLRLQGEEVDASDPHAAIANGVAFVSEDRTVSGYVAHFSVDKTTSLPFLGKVSRLGWLPPAAERSLGRAVIERLDVRPPKPAAAMSSLSGGNQQKVILGRWLEYPLRLLLLDEPTHGIDIGAKENIYALLQELSASGLPIVLASSEFEELEALCTRVILLHEGAKVGELTASDATSDVILASLLRLYTAEPKGNEHVPN